MNALDAALIQVSPLQDAAQDASASDGHIRIEAAEPPDGAEAGLPVVLTFGFAQWQRPPAFDFVGRLRKLEGVLGRRFHRIHLRDPQLSWYLRGIPGLGHDLGSTLESLRRIIHDLQPSRLLTLGQSMGGYGALFYGLALGADRVLSFGALSTMDAAVALGQGDRRWLPVMQALADSGLAGEATDLLRAHAQAQEREREQGRRGTDIRLHYGQAPDEHEHGPENLDLFHARRLAALPGCRLRLHPASGHAVVEHLRQTEALDATLLHELFDIDPERVHSRRKPLLQDNWLQWIAENRLANTDMGSMLAAMRTAGFDETSMRSAVAAVVREPAYKAAAAMLARGRAASLSEVDPSS